MNGKRVHLLPLVSLLLCLILALGPGAALAQDAEPVYEPTFETLELDTGITLRYARLGNAGDPAVVLIHGATDSYLSYSQLAPRLAAAGYCVYVPELRGHGGTDKPEEGPYTLTQHVSDLCAFMKALSIESPHLVGHSLGSFVAQALAAEHGDSLEIPGITLIATAASTVGNPTLTWMLYGDEDFPGVGVFIDGVPEEFIAGWTETDNEDPEFGRRTYEHALALPPHSWVYTFFGLENADNTALLSQITCPVQIIWGDGDDFFSQEDQQAIQAALIQSPRVEHLVIEGAGHNTHWDAGALEPVAEAILTFLEETK